jgi:hypothetical protein
MSGLIRKSLKARNSSLLAARGGERGPMSETEIHALFGRNKSQTEIRRALGGLQEAGKVGTRTERTQGPPATMWEPR